MQISLSKVYAIIDEERGKLLPLYDMAGMNGHFSEHDSLKQRLRLLNNLKRKFALVSDADQLPLGL